MSRLFGLFRTTVFLGWLAVMLATTTIAAGVWALQMSATVATMSAQAVATAVAHRKQLAKAVARTRAKARLRRAVVAVPVLGGAALAYFEERDYRDWLEENPGGTRQRYACEVAALSAAVMDDVLQELPEPVRPSPALIAPLIGDCP